MAAIETRLTAVVTPWLTLRPLRVVGLVMLCAAYLQGAVTKLFDFDAAVGEMEHFGLHPAPVVAAVLIVFELCASAMVITGYLRWAAATSLGLFTLLATFFALRFWELPIGMPRKMAANAFFEHIGLAGAFLIVAWHDLSSRRRLSSVDDLS